MREDAAGPGTEPVPWLPVPRGTRAQRGVLARLREGAGLGEPRHPAVRIRRDLRVPMRDGTVLVADHLAAHDDATPVVLIRTPYGRDGTVPTARAFAERGLNVVVQECRGTFASGGGAFEPFAHERDDGTDTLAWIARQPWCDGTVHTFGSSYVGLTQWALVDDADDTLASMSIGVSARSFRATMLFQAGGIDIQNALTWFYALHMQQMSTVRRLARFWLAPRRLRRASLAVPPEDAVDRATGAATPAWRAWLRETDPDGPYWRARTFASDVSRVPPVTLVAGWQDLFLTGQIADFQQLQAAGRRVRLIVGPWTHMSPEPGHRSMREAVRQLEHPDDAWAGPAVEYAVAPGGAWRTAARWPPPSTPQELVLAPGGALEASGGDARTGSTAYRYDPARPTPSAGGRTLYPFDVGVRRQRRRERRADVVCWTTPPLDTARVIAGDPVVRLRFASTAPRPDLFVRLADVDAKGASRNVTDGYVRLDAAAQGAVRDVELRLAPTAHAFGAGHRIRVQVSSGAHPLHLRNPGTDDPTRDHARLRASEQTIEHGPGLAVLVLPLLDDDGGTTTGAA